MNVLFHSPLIFIYTILCLGHFAYSNTGESEPLVCEDNQFKCMRRCIPESWRCDGDYDCIDEDDKSDEENCPSKTCPEDEFTCRSGHCVPRRWTCDHETDCLDGSDETDICKNKTCAKDQFSCGNGECIPASWRCDGSPDCSNGEDETCDSPTCASDEFRCNNSKCVNNKWKCDGDDDCGDNSDEKLCPAVNCTADEFQCSDKQCIDKLWQCDGDPDCNDQSDETNCTTNVSICSEDTEWECHTGEQCIHESWKCDGDEDCLDGSDELQCNTTCRPDQFKCNNSDCIYHTLKCDGSVDCVDGSDEAGCPPPVSHCPADRFDCYKNGSLCIEASKLCDSRKDCENFADEDNTLCETNPCNLNNGGCMHTCIPIGTQHRRCECLDGYRLQGNTSCVDVNECDQWPPVCSQKCVNEPKGSYKCECMPGYYPELLSDGQHICKVVGERPWLLFANRHDIRKLEVDTMILQPVVSDLHSAVAVDYDYYNKVVYWSDNVEEKIMKANMSEKGETNGTGIPVISRGVKTPDGIAVDWIYHNLYWTDTGYNTIEVASVDGSIRKILVDKDLDEPRSIALDPENGWMYFSDWGRTPKIERIGMDGNPTSRSVIVRTDIEWPNGLTLDYASERLYWIDAKLKSIFTAKLDGSDIRRVLHNAEQILHPFSLTVFEDNVYWTDWSSEAIRKVHKYTGQEYTQLALGLRAPMDIKVYHQQKQVHSPNKCGFENGGCSHLCLPIPVSLNKQGYACACPDNMVLQSGKQCEVSAQKTTTSPLPTPPSKTDSPNNTNRNSSSSHGVPAVSTTVPPSVPTKATDKPKATTSKPVVTSKGPGHIPISTETPYEIVTPKKNNETVVKKSTESPVGTVAVIAIAVVLGIAVLVVIIGCFIYRKYTKRNIKSMNFDNPVYRKTTEESVRIQRDSALEPLNADTMEV
ncbi:very low-density lipoprotein receptor-like isoform X1 [Saccostrea echinata]|uniref:very low-density lipoprotein receptor-like isoform X1 n=1 Tax=Saccostrea echinata TaxID=191078 RepID=UPI002A81F5A0|nr:very low-density lipoprotein receptor-like isoform X1 [Saccostrea echinata]